jgi:hypothetical protein
MFSRKEGSALPGDPQRHSDTGRCPDDLAKKKKIALIRKIRMQGFAHFFLLNSEKRRMSISDPCENMDICGMSTRQIGSKNWESERKKNIYKKCASNGGGYLFLRVGRFLVCN